MHVRLSNGLTIRMGCAWKIRASHDGEGNVLNLLPLEMGEVLALPKNSEVLSWLYLLR